jgi:hypothetical protein
MSTKTTFKRVALATVAALGFGLLSSVPANAAGGDVTAAYINKSTTIDTVATTQGTNSTAGLANADSISAMTAPTGAAIAFKVTGTGGTPLFGTDDLHQLIVNDQLISVTAGTAAATNTLASWTAPATAGTYTVKIRTYVDGTAAPTAIIENSLALTLSASAGKTEMGLSNVTTADTIIVSAVGVTKKNSSGRVGVPVVFHPNFTAKINAGTANTTATTTGKATLRYTVASPAAAAVTVYAENSAITTSATQTVVGVGSLTRAGTTDSASYTTPLHGTAVQFTPATAGSYVITTWHDANNDTLQGAGEAVATSTIVVAAEATPAVAVTQYGSALGGGADDTFGKLVKICLTNSTNPAGLSSLETLAISFDDTGARVDRVSSWSSGVFSMGTNVDTATQSLTSANFNGSGCAYMNVRTGTALGGTASATTGISTVTMTTTGTGGAFAGYSNTTAVSFIDSATYVATAAAAHTSTNFLNGAGTYSAAGTLAAATTGVNNTTATWYQPLGASSSMNLRGTLSAAEKSKAIRVVDTSGKITGVAGATYVSTAYTVAASTTPTVASWTVTTTLDTDESYQLVVPGIDASWTQGGSTITVSGQARAAASVTSTPATVRAVAAAVTKSSVQVLDQFGDGIANIAVTPSVAGRNASTGTLAAVITNADGKIAYSLTDASTSTVLLTDTVTFSTAAGQSLGAAAKTGTLVVNYGAAVVPATITVTGGASADTGATVTYSAISTAVAGADAAGLVTMTAVLKDAAGATVPAGVAVTWASSLTNSAIVNNATYGDLTTTYTDGTGTATTRVYSWAVGTSTITATSTVVGTGKINFSNAAGDVRVLTATVKDNVITAKVVDRYGNPVSGISITATRTVGAGYFGGNGSSTSTAVSAVGTGSVDFIIIGGDATVTVATTTLNDGQTSSAAGFVGITAVTATGVGATIAPAGVQSVSVEVTGLPDNAQAAADAAAEATDAANAATDAANAAAEAADAATAAAQDAADAVAALSTQVATYISNLRKQITALTNLVIKIQKKVNA